mgnify:CR=1 FL=1
MGATETVDLFFELINDDARDKAVNLFADMGVQPGTLHRFDHRLQLSY